MRLRSAAFASLLLSVWAAPFSAVFAQETTLPGPCRASPCVVLVEWGGPIPNIRDLRYGYPGEFEDRVRKGLIDAGYQLGANPVDEGFRIRLRPNLVAARCEQVPGMTRDMSCRTIGEVRVDFLDADPARKLPGNVRIQNRCSIDERMDIAKFSAYAAALIDYILAGDETRKRPNARC
jgi:hypothetical protein